MAENSEEEELPARLIDTRSDLADLMPEAIARECNVLPQPRRGTTLRILMSNSFDFDTIDRVTFCCGGPVEVALATGRAIREAIDQVYGMPEA